MKNFIQPGDVLDFVATVDVVGGQPLLIGDVFGVVAADTLAGASGVLDVVGVFDLPMAAVSPTKFTKAYWDDAAKLVTDDASGNSLIGVFVNAGASGDATIHVRLSGFTV